MRPSVGSGVIVREILRAHEWRLGTAAARNPGDLVVVGRHDDVQRQTQGILAVLMSVVGLP